MQNYRLNYERTNNARSKSQLIKYIVMPILIPLALIAKTLFYTYASLAYIRQSR